MKFLKAVAVGAALVVSMSGPVFAQAKNMTAQEQANLKLVLDWWGEVLQAGHLELAPKYMAEDYIQHNPNVVSGRDALVKYIKQTRPARELKPLLDFPVISITAEGDIVVIAIVSWQDDEEGKRYANTHFDMFRIENGKIAEHWDPAQKQ